MVKNYGVLLNSGLHQLCSIDLSCVNRTPLVEAIFSIISRPILASADDTLYRSCINRGPRRPKLAWLLLSMEAVNTILSYATWRPICCLRKVWRPKNILCHSDLDLTKRFSFGARTVQLIRNRLTGEYIAQRHLACGNWMKGRRVFSYMLQYQNINLKDKIYR